MKEAVFSSTFPLSVVHEDRIDQPVMKHHYNISKHAFTSFVGKIYLGEAKFVQLRPKKGQTTDLGSGDKGFQDLFRRGRGWERREQIEALSTRGT